MIQGMNECNAIFLLALWQIGPWDLLHVKLLCIVLEFPSVQESQ